MIVSVPETIQRSISDALSTRVTEFSFTNGGCINNGGALQTSAGKFFLKWNDRGKFPGMFEAEGKGLELLAAAHLTRIPKVALVNETSVYQYIVLEFIEPGKKSDEYWETLGHQLAALHRISSPTFGLDHNNYIGSLPQDNTSSEDWIDFFITSRLEAQVQLANQHRKIDKGVVSQFESLYKKLPDLLPSEKPSLLHGDLWSGNLITDDGGNPCLIDPAVYYGHREIEIAFTQLFGGFSERFYRSYHENFPLLPGFNQRSDIYNLYPLMVHVNLFGGGYFSQVVSILRKFV